MHSIIHLFLTIRPYTHPHIHSTTQSIQPHFYSNTLRPSTHPLIHSPIQTTLYPLIRPSTFSSTHTCTFIHPPKQPSIHPSIRSPYCNRIPSRQTAKSSPPTTGLVAIETQ